MPTVGAALDRAATALDALARRGEAIEDEWLYVTDLERVWRDHLDEVAAARGPEELDATLATAIEEAIAETERITDPHRAIDWLSTFPQVVLLALGEAP